MTATRIGRAIHTRNSTKPMITTALRSSVTVASLPEESSRRESADRIRTFRILIVDDNRDVARGLAGQLRRRGHRVLCAHTGAAALKLAQVFQPEFVLVEAELPDLSGYEIAALLPGVICPARLRVVSKSGDGLEGDPSFSQASGCVLHLRKPVEVAEIEGILGRMQRQSGWRMRRNESPSESGGESSKVPREAGAMSDAAAEPDAAPKGLPGDILTPEKGGLSLLGRTMSHPQGNPRFPTTRWTGVLQLRGTSDQAMRKEALGNLCRDYWYPLYAFARRQGRSQEDAEDLTQGFFAYALEHEVFGQANREVGTLRTFLLKVFQRHMGGVRDRERAQKRGGGLEFVSLNLEDGEVLYSRDLATEDSPELLFDRSWAQALLRAAVASLAASEKIAGREQQFGILQTFLTPVGAGEQCHEAAGRELEMTVEAVRQAVCRLRKKFRVCLREEIAATLHEPDEARIDAELHALKAALSR